MKGANCERVAKRGGLVAISGNLEMEPLSLTFGYGDSNIVSGEVTMFQRFAAGTAIASIAIAIAALILALIPRLTFERIYPLTIIWCCAPLAWGVWALLTPLAWVPKRLPLWGAILGLFAGSMAAFVLNLPSRFLGESVPIMVRAVVVLVMTLFYYVTWTLVRGAYRWLAGTTST